jgi:double-stranded uracil-DNA glycosylase
MSKPNVIKPTSEQIQNAKNKTLNDVIARRLRVLFCGINPGLYSAAVGHNFARPGNRFWPALYQSGFTERLLHPSEERGLLSRGCGITNIVERATASADELSKIELIRGAEKLQLKVTSYAPFCLAVVGLTAYRIAFNDRHATIGLQQNTIGKARIWILPNTSGLNAHHQLTDLTRYFQDLRNYVMDSP